MKDNVDELTGGLVSKVESKWTTFKGNITKFSTEMKEAVSKDFTNLVTNGDTSFSNMRTLLEQTFGTMKSNLTKTANNLASDLSSALGGAASKIGSAFSNMWDRISDVFDSIGRGIKSLASTVARKAEEIWDDITSANNARNSFDDDDGYVNSGPGVRNAVKSVNPFSGIPQLAHGGIIKSPTVAMMGEYNGARTNPEIVSPQSIIEGLINAGNNDLISVWLQTTRQIIAAIDSKDLDVSITDRDIASSVIRSNNSYRNRTGKPLFA